MLEDGEQSMHKAALYTGFTLDFMRDYNLDVSYDYYKVLPVDKLRKVKLPDDYVDYIKIGVQIGDHIKDFIRDKKINLLPDEQNCEAATNPPTNDVHNDMPLMLWFILLSQFYFRQQNGVSIQVDFMDMVTDIIKNLDSLSHNGYIQLSSSLSNEEIYLEYVSNSQMCGGDVFVPIIAEQAMKEYIRWQEIEVDRNAVHWEKVQLKKIY